MAPRNLGRIAGLILPAIIKPNQIQTGMTATKVHSFVVSDCTWR